MDDAPPHRHPAAHQDLANLLLAAAVHVSHTADLLRQLADAIPYTAEHTTITDARRAIILIDQARQHLIASADTLTGFEEPT